MSRGSLRCPLGRQSEPITASRCRIPSWPSLRRGIDAGVAGASWYPLACCGNIDCFPITCDQLVETVSGWLYVPTGNLFKREQVQPSQDRQCHVCLGRGREHRSICAFIVSNV